jgi:hypothetical protein
VVVAYLEVHPTQFARKNATSNYNQHGPQPDQNPNPASPVYNCRASPLQHPANPWIVLSFIWRRSFTYIDQIILQVSMDVVPILDHPDFTSWDIWDSTRSGFLIYWQKVLRVSSVSPSAESHRILKRSWPPFYKKLAYNSWSSSHLVRRYIGLFLAVETVLVKSYESIPRKVGTSFIIKY